MSGSSNTWLRWLHATALFVYIAALGLAVALVVIGFIPGSTVSQELPTAALTGLDRLGGVTAGVVAEHSGWATFQFHDPSLGQRLLQVATEVPGLVVIAEIGRRMAKLVRTAQDNDPFTADTARALVILGKLTAWVGVGTWILSQVAQGVLSAMMLTSSFTYKPHDTPLGWIAVGLIFAAFGRIIGRGVAMRAELDTVI